MTLHRLASSRGLLARKGAASPLGLLQTAPGGAEDDPSAGIPGEDPAAERPVAEEEPRQLTLVSDLESGDVTEAVSEPPPPASLLPFALHWKGRDQGDTWELVSPNLFERISQDKVEVAAKEAVASPEPGHRKSESESKHAAVETKDAGEAKKSGEPADRSSVPMAADSGTAPVTQESDAAVENAPVADPKWRAGARADAQWPAGASWMGWGVAAAILVGGIGWWSITSQAPAPESPAPVAAVPSETVTDAKTPMAEPAAPEKNAPVEPSAASAAPASADQPARPPALAEPEAPSVDLVRVEPNGEAVIAGRAAPNSELIILNNGTPIGTAIADTFGEWVFVPEKPLPQGAHEFGLVLKSVQGKVTIPAEPTPAPETASPSEAPAGPVTPNQATPSQSGEEQSLLAPLPPRKPDAAPAGSAIVAPIPARKPDWEAKSSSQSFLASPPSADFVVQLASVKTRAGARQEWRKLRSRYPEALSGMNLSLYEAELLRQGTVIRVRTGPFPGFSEAANFCAQIRTDRQECLVVRTSGGN